MITLKVLLWKAYSGLNQFSFNTFEIAKTAKKVFLFGTALVHIFHS